jgi:hypothetical protein
MTKIAEKPTELLTEKSDSRHIKLTLRLTKFSMMVFYAKKRLISLTKKGNINKLMRKKVKLDYFK